MELAIDREATILDLDFSFDEAIGDLFMLEYEYCPASAATKRVETAVANATSKLYQLTRRLAKITPKETPEIDDAVKHVVTPPSKIPDATAEKIRERGRAKIQQLLSSYVCRKMAHQV